MTPGARLAAAIELIEKIAAPDPGLENLPADAVVAAYARERRYIGAKDRRAVADLVFDTLRWRARLDAGLGGAAPTARLRVLRAAMLLRNQTLDTLAGQCDGDAYRPAPLTEAERAALAAPEPAEAPLWARASFPAWLENEIARRFGADAFAEMTAFNAAAPVDLRVNLLKATREAAIAALARARIAARPTPFAATGLRLGERAALTQSPPYREGWVEPQDEASQLVADLADVRPGLLVLDLCAGAGGKTLALAARMANRGRLVAADSDGKRLARMEERLARSGAAIVERRIVGDDLAGLGEFDRVLVDAPCSGSGTWRRAPEAKWRLTPERLARYRESQAALLARAADRVAAGGRLVYAVCSILPGEGEDQAARFLAARPDFRRVAPADLWPGIAPGPAQGPPPCPGPDVLLTPHRHGTDGFYAAVFARRA